MADTTTPISLATARRASYHMMLATSLANAATFQILSTYLLRVESLGGSYKLAGTALAIGSLLQTISLYFWSKLGSHLGFEKLRAIVSFGAAISGIGLIVNDLTVVVISYIVLASFLHGFWISSSFYMKTLNQEIAIEFVAFQFSVSMLALASGVSILYLTLTLPEHCGVFALRSVTSL